MELALAVYFINTLTIQTNFFFTLMVLSLVGIVGVKLFNVGFSIFNKDPVGTTYKVLDTFHLNGRIFEKDSEVTITSWEGRETAYINGVRCTFSNVLPKLMKVSTNNQPAYTPLKVPKYLIWVMIISGAIHTFIPTKQVAMYMAGAYITQQVLESEYTKELGKAALETVKSWSKEAPELVPIVNAAVTKLGENNDKKPAL